MMVFVVGVVGVLYLIWDKIDVEVCKMFLMVMWMVVVVILI